MPASRKNLQLAIDAVLGGEFEKAYAPLTSAARELRTPDFKRLLRICTAQEVDSQFIHRLAEKGADYCREGDYDAAIRACILVYQLLITQRKAGDLLFWTASLLGQCLSYTGKNREAFDYLEQALSLATEESLSSPYLQECCFRASQVALANEDIALAAKYFAQINADTDLKSLGNDYERFMMDFPIHWRAADSVVEAVIEKFVHRLDDIEGDYRLRAAVRIKTYLSTVSPEQVKNLLNKLRESVDSGSAALDLTARLRIPDTAPRAQVREYTEELHGVQVQDSYRWMEQADDEREAWCQGQNAYAVARLISMERDFSKIERPRESRSVPWIHHDRWFYLLEPPDEPGQSLCFSRTLAGHGTRIIDHKILVKNNEELQDYALSADGKLVAFAVSQGGSDWWTLRIKLSEADADLMEDTLSNIRHSSPCWSSDGSGLFYVYVEGPDFLVQSIRFHLLGTNQSEDTVVFRGKKGEGLSVQLFGDYLVVLVLKTDYNSRIFLRKEQDSTCKFREVLRGVSAYSWIVRISEGKAYVLTNLNAPNFRFISIDLKTGRKRDVIAESGEILSRVAITTDCGMVAAYQWSGRDRLVQIVGDSQVEIPSGIGDASYLTVTELTELTPPEIAWRAEGYTSPAKIYSFNLISRKIATVFEDNKSQENVDEFVTRQIEGVCTDGSRLPVFVCHKKNIVLDGSNPTWVTGYGGFRISASPRYDWSISSWLSAGGIYAQVILRGGLEFGTDWYQRGRLEGRPQTIKDFITAAELLIEHGYTSSTHMAAAGGSNGGLLVGAAMLQRPELFSAIVVRDGLFDMLRYHKFGLAWQWKEFYGSAEDPEQFRMLMSYSPLHNVKPAVYPATLIQAAINDDRVYPCHSMKFAAALQNAQLGDAPVLLRSYVNEGHSATGGNFSYAGTDKLAFMACFTGLKN